MALFLKQYVTEHITKILSWSPESQKVFQVQDVVQWCVDTPIISTFRVNTSLHTTDEVVTFIEQEFAKKSFNSKIPSPTVRVHKTFPECIIIEKLPSESLDSNLTQYNDEIIVDSLCGAAILRGADIFAPGVIGMSPSVNIGTKVAVYADLSMKCLKGFKNTYDDEGKLFVGNGTVLMNRYQLFNGNKQPHGVAVKMICPTSGIVMVNCPSDFGILQNLPSIVCVRVLDPKPGDVVLDMCAAPGNKTTHISTLMHDEGILIAIDKATKLKHIETRCKHSGIRNCIRIFAGNSCHIVSEKIDKPTIEGPPFSRETFDKILLDAACSGLGNRPMLRNTVASKSKCRSFATLQKRFIENAVPLLKSGGILVYSTCSILCEENECVVAWVLQRYSEMELVPAEPRVGGLGLPVTDLREEQCRMVQRFGPGSDDGSCIGFFIAKLRKK